MPNLKTITAAFALTVSAATFAAQALAVGAHTEHVTKYDELPWEQVSEGTEAAILWGSEEGGDAVKAFRTQPGVEFPLHGHTNDYYGLAIQGKWVHIDSAGHEVTTAQESYVYVKGGEFHGDRCAGPEVCIMLIDMDGAHDLFFPE